MPQVKVITHLFPAVVNSDYTYRSVRVTFNPAETRKCERINLIDDRTQELQEMFSVSLSRTMNLDSRIMILQSEAEITITDSDRE